jgi:uncharacterized membrane protein
MKSIGRFLLQRLVAGLLVIAPLYLSILLLAKAMGSLVGLVRPVAKLLPDWLPAEQLIALVLVLGLCLVVGIVLATSAGRAARERIEHSLLERIPGYGLIRSLSQQVAGQGQGTTWTPALAEIEDALVPAFVIEELPDGRYTIFVPSVPTPLAGAVYILERSRVHPIDVPFTQAIKVVSRWGQGGGELVRAMEPALGRVGVPATAGAGDGPQPTVG